VVHNGAKDKRNFEITGEGIDKKFLMSLSPDETKVLHVDMKPGSFKANALDKDDKSAGSESLTAK
jgi:hypothetical protein